jgi:hypothetical protein
MKETASIPKYACPPALIRKTCNHLRRLKFP